MIGQTLDGRYAIVEEVGRGGIGVVYRAKQISAKGRDVAVKVLLPSALSSHNAVTRFENEAAIIGTLRHPNTICMFDSGRTEDGRLYVVTEFLEGETLMTRLDRGPLSQLDAVNTLIPIARSLDEAHARGVVHRDLKLANIFLERVGEEEVVKVLDFGIAKLVDHERITAPMQIFGTPGFMSPEQCRGGEVTASSDLFALGILGFSILTQRFPYDGGDANALIVATLTKAPHTLSAVRPEVRWEPALEALLNQLLAYDPGDRLPSAGAVAEALENVHRMLDHTAGVVLPGQVVGPSRDTRRAESGEEFLPTLPLVAPPTRSDDTTPPLGAPSPLRAESLLAPPTPDESGPTLAPDAPLAYDDVTKPPRSTKAGPDVLRRTVPSSVGPPRPTPLTAPADQAGTLDTLPILPDVAATTRRLPARPPKPDLVHTAMLVLAIVAVLGSGAALVWRLVMAG